MQFSCPKCGSMDYTTGQIRAAGGFWSKIFDVQNKHFTTVSCSGCKYTEMYKADTNKLGNIFDFFTG